MNKNFRLSDKIYIIAEICSNHNGDMNLAFKLIDEAKKAGCDCVKFQSWDRDLFSEKVYKNNSFLEDGRELDGSLEEQVKKYALSFKDLSKLRDYCKNINIDFASSVFTPKQLQELISLQPAFIKIASMDLNYDLLITKVGLSGYPTIISTGLSDLKEVEHAVKTFEATKNDQLILLHCKAVYPPSDELTDLNNIDLLKENFNYSIGFSDHSVGIDIPIASFGRGAEVFEKHFTLDKKMEGWDHANSATPEEMKQIVQAAKRIPLALGKKERSVFEEELLMRRAFRRSIVAKHEIKRGQKITLEMLDFKRPGTGLEPNNYSTLLGKIADKDIQKDEMISYDNIKKD